MWRAASAWMPHRQEISQRRTRVWRLVLSKIRWPWCRRQQELGAPSRIVEAVVAVNDERKLAMARKIEAAFGGVKGKTIAVLGLTFKPNTDDMRDAPSLVILPYLQKAGAIVRAFDPEGRKEASKLMSLDYGNDTYDTLGRRRWRGDPDRMERIPRAGFRQGQGRAENAADGGFAQYLPPRQMAEAGFRYVSVGRPDA